MVQLNGTDGQEAWRVNAGSYGATLTIDASGNIVGAMGDLCVKIDPAGNEVWRTPTEAYSCEHVLSDASSDVIAQQASTSQDRGVRKLSGIDGDEIWRRTVTGLSDARGFMALVALHPTGDVLGAAYEGLEEGAPVFAFRLSSEDGSDVWRRQVEVSGARSAYGPDGSLALAGFHKLQGNRYGLAKLNADTGADW